MGKKKSEPRERRWLAQSHTASKWQGWDLSLESTSLDHSAMLSRTSTSDGSHLQSQDAG